MSEETEWSFKLKQDGLTVAQGFGFDKDFVIAEAEHYLLLYLEEDFEKTTIEVKRRKKDSLGKCDKPHFFPSENVEGGVDD